MQTHQHGGIIYPLQCVYQLLLQQLAQLPRRPRYRGYIEYKHRIQKTYIHRKLLRLTRFRHCPINTAPVTVKFQIGMTTLRHVVVYQPQHLHNGLLQRAWFLLQVQYLGCIEYRLATLDLHVHHKACTRHQLLRQNEFICLIFCTQNQLITGIRKISCFENLCKSNRETFEVEYIFVKLNA